MVDNWKPPRCLAIMDLISNGGIFMEYYVAMKKDTDAPIYWYGKVFIIFQVRKAGPRATFTMIYFYR